MSTQPPVLRSDDYPGALDGRSMPPRSMLARLRYYGQRNGYLYALASYVGRHSHAFWKFFAPAFSRNRIRRWIARPGEKIVNLGGGANLFDRWLTADVDARADVYVDILHPLPFGDGTLDVIYLEEVIEHISREQGRSLITECLRALKPGGHVRLTTPDLDAFVASFDGTDAAGKTINDIFYEHGHRHIYSRAAIYDLLTDAGFIDIRESCFRDADSRFGYFDTHPLRFAVSNAQLAQYWEASKR
jgi:predicted SAM-dependent methyltransferase